MSLLKEKIVSCLCFSLLLFFNDPPLFSKHFLWLSIVFSRPLIFIFKTFSRHRCCYSQDRKVACRCKDPRTPAAAAADPGVGTILSTPIEGWFWSWSGAYVGVSWNWTSRRRRANCRECCRCWGSPGLWVSEVSRTGGSAETPATRFALREWEVIDLRPHGCFWSTEEESRGSAPAIRQDRLKPKDRNILVGTFCSAHCPAAAADDDDRQPINVNRKFRFLKTMPRIYNKNKLFGSAPAAAAPCVTADGM